MALGTILQEYKGSLAGLLKVVIYKITDTGGTGGTVDISVNHICWANAVDVTDGDNVTAAWTEDSETITLGASGAGHTVRLIVLGWGG
jgi:hypothetical protein